MVDWSQGGVLVGGLLFMMALGPSPSAWAQERTAQAKESRKSSIESPPHFRGKTYIKRRWGVEVMYVRQSAAGYMLEFRYKVLDPEKAKELMKRQTKPLLTHVKSGAKLAVPTPETTGPMRNTYQQVVGKTYWMLFANPGKLVKPGDRVDIEIGEFRIKGLIVR